jgi:DNA primase
MPKSKFIDFKAVKAAITMEQVLEHYGLLHQFKKSGDRLSGPCPIHKGSSPNQFSVSIEKNVWNCFSECKHGGNVLDFIQKMEDVSILAAANKAIEWFHLDPKEMSASSEQEAGETSEAPKTSDAPRPKPAAKPAPVQENGTPNKPLQFRLDKLQREHPYLAERGLTLETIADFGVGFCDKGMMAGRIAIPINNSEGKVVAYAGRSIDEPSDDNPKYKLPPGFRKSLEVFNLDRAIKEPADKPLVIVEGFFDCMKIYQHGYRKVIALMGSTMSHAQEKLIRRHTNGNSHVIVMLDENEAGKFGRQDSPPPARTVRVPANLRNLHAGNSRRGSCRVSSRVAAAYLPQFPRASRCR